jgi:hypothetical protein
MTGELSIDRLILDMPGLDAEHAVALAGRIGEGLADSSGDFASLSVQLDSVPGETPERLAARIVAALLQRIG